MSLKSLLFVSIIWTLSISAVYSQDDDYVSDEDYEVRFDSGTFYTIKIGMGANNQSWSNGLQTDIAFTPVVDFAAETYNFGSASRLYAQVGIHQRGSGLGFGFQRFATYKFTNVLLEFGGKRLAFDRDEWDGWWQLGINAEYTIADNLDDASGGFFNVVTPEFLNRFNYGATAGLSTEYKMGPYQYFTFEVAFYAGLSAQYDQPFAIPYTDPINPAQMRILNPQQVRNFALEIKVGYKWLY